MSHYAWIVTVDHLTTDPADEFNRTGFVGPRGASKDLLDKLRDDPKKHGAKHWRTLDDDGEMIHEGYYLGPDDDTMFSPLNDLSMPDAGATEIQYRTRAGWEAL